MASDGKQQKKPPAKKQSGPIMDRSVPNDHDAEAAVIGCIILNQECFDDVLQVLEPDDFFDVRHEILFRNLMAMYENNRRIDGVTFVDQLKRAGDYDSIGGAVALSQVVNVVPHAGHVNHYAEIVREKSVARKLIEQCTTVIVDAYDGGIPTDDLIARAEAGIARVSDSTIQGRDTQDFNSVAIEALAALEQRMTNGENRILATGYDCLQSCMGLIKGGLTILAGRPSQGKSAFAAGIVANVARRERVVYFASLEMSSLELAERMLSAEARVDCRKMMNGSITVQQRDQIIEAAGNMACWRVRFDDRASLTLAQIGAAARRVKRRDRQLDLLVIDYLQLIVPERGTEDNRVEQLGKICRGLKRLARELQVPVLCLAQVNRQAEDNADKRPRLHQLKGTGDMEQDADSVLFVHRPASYIEEKKTDYEAEVAEILMAKNRNGPVDKYEVLFFREWMTWANKAAARHEEFDQYNAAGQEETWG